MTSPEENISAIATLELFLISKYSRELKSDKYRRRDTVESLVQRRGLGKEAISIRVPFECSGQVPSVLKERQVRGRTLNPEG